MSPKTWCVPPFELSEATSGEAGEALRIHNPPEGVELVPALVGQIWVLQESAPAEDPGLANPAEDPDANLELLMNTSVNRFLFEDLDENSDLNEL